MERGLGKRSAQKELPDPPDRRQPIQSCQSVVFHLLVKQLFARERYSITLALGCQYRQLLSLYESQALATICTMSQYGRILGGNSSFFYRVPLTWVSLQSIIIIVKMANVHNAVELLNNQENDNQCKHL